MARIHVTGASGSGTTTLGAALAEALGVPHRDTDDFYWLPTDPPYVTPRPVEERLALLAARLAASPSWVLSGSAMGWGAPVEACFDHVVFLSLDPALRMERLRRREAARHGARIAPGGDMAAGSAAFLDWAAAYDSGAREGRSRPRHEAWLAGLRVPVQRLDSAAPVPALRDAVLRALRPGAAGPEGPPPNPSLAQAPASPLAAPADRG